MSRFVTSIQLGFLIAILSAPLAQVRAADYKNIILILVDDLGWGDLGSYGHPHFKTPRIDSLAREGARLTNFYAPVPYCAPSRAALLTGRFPSRCGLTKNPVPAADLAGETGYDDLGLPTIERTLADVFRDSGYRTACFGKWHLGHKPRFLPTQRGFDEYFGILYSNDMHPVELWESDRKIEYPVVQTSLTTRLAEHAVSFITTNRDRPFFLYLPHVAVHKPLAASESLLGRSGHGLYADTLADLDLAVGRALETIKSLGLESRTLVLFTSDNGPWFGGSTGGLRGMKSQSWEGGLRIPLLARLPGVIPAGHVSHQPATNMDLFPTTLALAGIKLPGDRPIDGRDITSLLVSDAPSPHEAIFSMRGDQLATVRAGKWKLHLIPPGPKVEKRFRPDEPWVDKRRPDGVRLIAPFDQAHPSQFPGSMDGPPAAAGLLFDLVADPAEQDDRAREFPEIVQELRQHARDFQARAVP